MTTPRTLMQPLWKICLSWTVLGLALGVYNRELTRQTGHAGFTQLSVSHTHALVLGTVIGLILLILVRVFPFDPRGAKRLLIVYNLGAGLTVLMLTVKGTLQVLDAPFANSPMLSGISGLSHIVLSGALIYLLVLLRRALRPETAEDATS